MIWPTDPPNKSNPAKNPSKGNPRTGFLAEFKEKFPDFFSYNIQINVRTLQLRSMRQAQNVDTLALNQLGCLKMLRPSDPISPLITISGIHLEPGCKSHNQIIHCYTAENVPKQARILSHKHAFCELFSDTYSRNFLYHCAA